MEPQQPTSTAKKKLKTETRQQASDTEASRILATGAIRDASAVASNLRTALVPPEVATRRHRGPMDPLQPHHSGQRRQSLEGGRGAASNPSSSSSRIPQVLSGSQPHQIGTELAAVKGVGEEQDTETNPANESESEKGTQEEVQEEGDPEEAPAEEEEEDEEEEDEEEEDEEEEDEEEEDDEDEDAEDEERDEEDEGEEEEGEEAEEYDESASTSSIAEQSHKPPVAANTYSPVIERSAGTAGVSSGADTRAGLMPGTPQGYYGPGTQPGPQGPISGMGGAHLPERSFVPYSELAHPTVELYYNYAQNRASRAGGRGAQAPLSLSHEVQQTARQSAVVAGPSSAIPRDTEENYRSTTRDFAGPWGRPGMLLPQESERLDKTSRRGESRSTTSVRSKVEKSSRRHRRQRTARARGASSQVQSVEGSNAASETSFEQKRRDDNSPASPYQSAQFQRAETWSPGYTDRFDKLVGSTYTEAAAAAAAAPGDQHSPIYRPQNYPERRPSSFPGDSEAASRETDENTSYEVGSGPRQDAMPPRAWQLAYEYYTQQQQPPLYGPSMFPVGHYGPPTALMHRAPTLMRPPQPPATPSHPELLEQIGNPGLSTQATLRIQGDLWDMTKDWSIEETKSGRRLVKFERAQQGVVVYLRFQAIEPPDYRQDMAVVSCIWRRETHEYFVTSVDCISLLQLIVNQKFSVEEKNRIRRNLEVCKPITVSKSKPELQDFFRKIMSFSEPKPRNIEKDVKVFLWSNLEGALKKIVSKYSASWGTGRG